MKVRASTREELGWLVERTGFAPTAAARGIVAVDASGAIRGCVGYDCWTQNAVQAHMAVDAPLVWRSLLLPAFEYPFEQCGRGVLLAVIPAWNRASLKLAEHFGFKRTHRVCDGWSEGVDLVFLEMRREDCVWLAQRKEAA